MHQFFNIQPKMASLLQSLFFFTLILYTSLADTLKTKVFLSPKILMEPGLVSNKNYFNIDFPRGHIAIKSFNAEVVDQSGRSVPLHETYLHHWILNRYYAPKNAVSVENNFTLVPNSGLCPVGLTQLFGLGAETRKTATHIPDPYGLEAGNPDQIPHGFEEGWVLNVHVIDTRGAVDRMGCAECRCVLYNQTRDDDGEALPSGYMGGLRCCRDDLKCRVKEGFVGEKRNLYVRYTIKYVDWNSTSILPVRVYIIDVTDVWTTQNQSTTTHNCAIEYDVGSCGAGKNKSECIDSRSLRVKLPRGGDVIYAVGHQHAGAISTALYGEGGRTICESYPHYGTGMKAGNEAGYIVGMSTCYPSPAKPVKIGEGEMLTFVSNYSSLQSHSGVMGLFYLLLADSSPAPNHA